MSLFALLLSLLHRLALVLAAPAQPRGFGTQFATILWLLGTIVAAAVLLGVIAWWFRRRLAQQASEAPIGLTMNDLRRMRDAGDLTDEEFEAARQTLLARHQARQQAAEAASDEASASDRLPPISPEQEAEAQTPSPTGDATRDADHTTSEADANADEIELGEELIDQPPKDTDKRRDDPSPPRDPEADDRS